MNDPLGELVAAAAAQHHAGAVEAHAVVEAADAGILAHQRLVVRREGLGAAHRALNTYLDGGWGVLVYLLAVFFLDPDPAVRIFSDPDSNPELAFLNN